MYSVTHIITYIDISEFSKNHLKTQENLLIILINSTAVVILRKKIKHKGNVPTNGDTLINSTKNYFDDEMVKVLSYLILMWKLSPEVSARCSRYENEKIQDSYNLQLYEAWFNNSVDYYAKQDTQSLLHHQLYRVASMLEYLSTFWQMGLFSVHACFDSLLSGLASTTCLCLLGLSFKASLDLSNVHCKPFHTCKTLCTM